MGLTKHKIGKLIIPFSKKCKVPNLTPDQVSGVNREKEFFEPSHQVGGNTSGYKIVPSGYFACNLMHVGRDCVLPIAFNHSGHDKIVSPAYSVFKLNEKKYGVLNEYFFIMLKCAEKDRFFWFNADASVRDGLSWEDFCSIEIDFPDIATQHKYVKVYKALVANQQSYERGLEDLKLVCDGYIEDLRRKIPCEELGALIERVDQRNVNQELHVSDVKSVNMDGTFAETVANVDEERIYTYKVVEQNDFAYTNRINIGSIARRLPTDGRCLVSASYDVFRITDVKKLSPEYLTLWIRRREFFRSTGYFAVGSVKDNYSVEMLKEVKIPIPEMKVQQAITDVYNVYIQRKRINEQLKAQIKNICPILIKGSLEEV